MIVSTITAPNEAQFTMMREYFDRFKDVIVTPEVVNLLVNLSFDAIGYLAVRPKVDTIKDLTIRYVHDRRIGVVSYREDHLTFSLEGIPTIRFYFKPLKEQ